MSKLGRTPLPIGRRKVTVNVALLPAELEAIGRFRALQSKRNGIDMTRSAVIRRALLFFLANEKEG